MRFRRIYSNNFTNNIVLCLIIVIYSSINGSTDAKEGIDLIEKNALEGRLMTIPCVLKFHELYLQTNESLPGATFIFNVLPTASRFQEEIMFGLSDYQKQYHNSSLIVRCSWQERHRNSFGTLNKATKYIMLLNQTIDIEYTLLKWQSLETWNSNAPVLVILYRLVKSTDIVTEIKEIFQIFLNFHMLDIYFIFNDKDRRISEIYTWYPYETTNCATRVEHIHRLDTCNNTQVFDKQIGPKTSEGNHTNKIFEKIPSNFHGCQLRVSAVIWEPYSFYQKQMVNDTIVDVWYGIEVFILRVIGQKLNMTIKFLKNSESRINKLFDHFDGIYKQLFQGEAHVLIGGLDSDIESSKALSTSTPYYSDDQTWCVAKARATSKWKNIFNIFTTELWIAIICALFVITITLNIFIKIERRHENIYWAFLRALAISMGLMPTFRPQYAHTRFVYFLFLLYGVMINATFNCFLISTLTRYRTDKQVKTLNDTTKNNFNYAGGWSSVSHFSVDDPVSQYIRQRFRLCKSIDACLGELNTKSKLAVALSRLHAMNSPSVDKSKIFCFSRDNNIYSFSVTMITTYDFPLLPQIDQVIRRLVEGGFITRWKNFGPSNGNKIANTSDTQTKPLTKNDNNAEVSTDDESDLDEENNETDNFTSLTIDHILGALVILIVGEFLATIVFLLENWSLRSCFIKRYFRFLLSTNTENKSDSKSKNSLKKKIRFEI